MNRKSKVLLISMILASMLSFASCGQTDNSSEAETTTAVQTTEADIATIEKTTKSEIEATTENPTEDTTEEITESKKDIIMDNEYVTRYEKVNMVTYPPFVFNYPDNWSVVREECDVEYELVTIENGEGARVTFYYYTGKLMGGCSNVNMGRIEISKAAPSQFVPGFVQATDYSDLGEFMVAKLKTTGIMDMKTDSEFTNVDGNVSYAVLPVSEQGTREYVRRGNSAEFTFWYSGTISFTASDTEDFTPQEEQEVIAILNSFRVMDR